MTVPISNPTLAPSNPGVSHPIFDAIETNKLGLVKKMITENEKLVFLQDKEGYTPLHIAVKKKNSAILQLFQENVSQEHFLKATTTQDNACECNPMHMAASMGDITLINQLYVPKEDKKSIPAPKKQGALTQKNKENGYTPLHILALQHPTLLHEILTAPKSPVLNSWRSANKIKDTENLFPTDYLKKKGLYDTASLLHRFKNSNRKTTPSTNQVISSSSSAQGNSIYVKKNVRVIDNQSDKYSRTTTANPPKQTDLMPTNREITARPPTLWTGQHRLSINKIPNASDPVQNIIDYESVLFAPILSKDSLHKTHENKLVINNIPAPEEHK